MNADKFFVFDRRLSVFIGGWIVFGVLSVPGPDARRPRQPYYTINPNLANKSASFALTI
jgi:hypothetical protein